jgi:4-hydroxybenzoate polyprenyltransferase
MLAALVQSARPRQWAKNIFVLAPLVFAQELTRTEALSRAALALLAFCCASSAVYLVNDLVDRREDRNHPLKRHRPLASGTLSVPLAGSSALLLAAAAIGVGVRLGSAFLAIAVAYLLINLLYSLWLKNVVILDVMIIAFGFVLRVLAGGAAIRVEVSAWLLLCTSFLALFLAFSKRRHELILMATEAPDQRKVLSHYNPAFLDQMINVVTASTVVAYAIYAISPETAERFHTRHLVYTIPMVLFGIFRYLYLIYQRSTERNPTEAILSDPPFLANMLLWAAAVIWIVYRA